MLVRLARQATVEAARVQFILRLSHQELELASWRVSCTTATSVSIFSTKSLAKRKDPCLTSCREERD